MVMYGADVEQLRAAAAQLSGGAGALENSARALHSLIGNGTYWRGPDADRFRAEWSSNSMRVVTMAVESLRKAADQLRRNADEQEAASRPGTSESTATGSEHRQIRAPQGVADLMREIRTTDKSHDGLKIQRIIGEDGTTRFIVYLNGTDAAERLTPARNLEVIGGRPDRYITDRIDEALREAGYEPGADGPEMMLVGFSQGGMDAQNIAASHRYNVTDLVTYGSPLTHRDQSDISTVHVRAKGDNVPDLPAQALALAGRDIAGVIANRLGLIDGIGDKVPVNEPWSGASRNIYETTPCTVAPENPFDALLYGNHGVPETYEQAGMNFDGSSDRSFTDERRSIARFEGTVADTWGPVPGNKK